MAYDLYMDGELLPVAPSKISIKHGGKNKTCTLINDGEVNLLKTSGLQEISFEVILPNVKYPFANYTGGFQTAEHYINKLKGLKDSKKPFQFIVSRRFPDGKSLFSTNIKVSLEDFTAEEEAKEGFDVQVSIKLKEYKDFGTKMVLINIDQGRGKVSPTRETAAAPTTGGRTYTVAKGDSLWKIAKSMYGNGADYGKISSANSSIIKNPNLIYPGQVLTIP